MKIQFWFFLVIFSISTINARVAYDHVLQTSGNYNLSLSGIEKKFSAALVIEEALLKNLNPTGVKIIKKTVLGRDFEIVVEKSIFGFVKRFTILGNLEVQKGTKICQANEEAFDVYFDFSQSGPEVTDAVAAFGLTICANTVVNNKVGLRTLNALYYRGKKYGIITEPIAKSVLNDQVIAFFNSVKITADQIK